MNKKINYFLNNKIYCDTKKYSLIIGLSPSTGARSPKLWNKVYKKLKINCKMYPADVSSRNLSDVISIIKRDSSFVGSAVTMPYKEKILKYLDKIDPNCKKIGSINTIIKKGNNLIGFNTDYLACKKSLNKFKRKRNVVILGAGGVGKSALISALEIFKNQKIFIYNRNYKKLLNFTSRLKNKNIKELENSNLIFKLPKVDLIVNATSVGFNLWQKNKIGYFNLSCLSPIGNIGKIYPVKSKNLNFFLKKNKNIHTKNLSLTTKFFEKNKSCQFFDIIYDPRKTILIKTANKFKNKNLNVLDMNLDQAVFDFSIVNKITNKNLIKKIMAKK